MKNTFASDWMALGHGSLGGSSCAGAARFGACVISLTATSCTTLRRPRRPHNIVAIAA
jgi:hypothetical protein